MSTRAKKMLSFQISCSVYRKFSIAVSGPGAFAGDVFHPPMASTPSFPLFPSHLSLTHAHSFGDCRSRAVEFAGSVVHFHPGVTPLQAGIHKNPLYWRV